MKNNRCKKYMTDGLNAGAFVAQITLAMLLDGFQIALIVQTKQMPIWMWLIILLFYYWEIKLLIFHLKVAPFDRVIFTSQGVCVKRMGRVQCELPWERIREVGIKYWTGKEKGRRWYGIAQYVYFSNHKLEDDERMQIGSCSQRGLAKTGIAFYCSTEYVPKGQREYYKTYPYPGVAELLPESVYHSFDFDRLCRACVLTYPYEGVEWAYSSGDGIITYTKAQVDQIASGLIDLCENYNISYVLCNISYFIVLFLIAWFI